MDVLKALCHIMADYGVFHEYIRTCAYRNTCTLFVLAVSALYAEYSTVVGSSGTSLMDKAADNYTLTLKHTNFISNVVVPIHMNRTVT